MLWSTPLNMVYLVATGLSYARWAVEAIAVQECASQPADVRPPGLLSLAQHGYCGLEGIVPWHFGEGISQADAAVLLQLLQDDGAMCRSFVRNNHAALAVQAIIWHLVAVLVLALRHCLTS